jgi:transcriptional regulator GlxA family with amidase domain
MEFRLPSILLCTRLSGKTHIIVCSGHDGYPAAGSKALGMLQLHHRRGGQVGGICTGAYTLARAGLLEDKKFTLHWGNQPAFEERFSRLEVSAQIYEKDAGIINCGGGRRSRI